jgi:hypothetical protein
MNIIDFITFISQSKKKNKRALEKIRHLQIHNKEFEHAITSVFYHQPRQPTQYHKTSIQQQPDTGNAFLYFLRSITAKYTIQINGDNMILIKKINIM